VFSVVNSALPAFAAEHRRPGCGKASHALAAATGYADGQTDGRTPDHYIDPAPHYYANSAMAYRLIIESD